MSTDNHITVLWAAKGGSGTTVTTAAAALHEVRDVVIVDLRGDMTDVLATPWPTVGLDDWLLGEPATRSMTSSSTSTPPPGCCPPDPRSTSTRSAPHASTSSTVGCVTPR